MWLAFCKKLHGTLRLCLWFLNCIYSSFQLLVPRPPTIFAIWGYVVYILYCPMMALDGASYLSGVCCGLNSWQADCHQAQSLSLHSTL